eukprot:TRINITY_DN9639_c0_g1_i1.p1 TRINITY_DN9639_c0_g1~~TRINITY_DN9639_c0_g1_i1.p1  ORF type:complete len:187 (+),score=24.88 TRINITY_DN9639_c0_g1_i1:247-807(+)
MWSNKIQSGVFFGIFTMIYLLVWLWDYSFLSLTCYVLLGIQILWFLYNIVTSRILGNDHLGVRFKNIDFSVSDENVRAHVDSLIKIWNVLVYNAISIFSFSNPRKSIKIGVTFFVLALVGRYFSDITVIYLGITFGFLWPKLYKEKKTQIDSFYDTAMKRANQQYDKIKDKVPLEKLGFLGKKKSE